MKRFRVGIARIECPRCHNASIETMISGKEYANGDLRHCVRSESHDLCYFESLGAATPEQVAAAGKKLEQLGWRVKKPEVKKAVAPVIPRDPSQSQQEWHEREDDEDHGRSLTPIFGDEDDPAQEVARENAEAVERQNFEEDHHDYP